MSHKLVALTVEAVLLDAMLGIVCYGRVVSFVAQEIIGWALEVLIVDELLDKIFDAYTEGDALMIRYAGRTTAVACRGDLCGEFPVAQERQLFAYGLTLCGAGRSRREVKRALKAVYAQLEHASGSLPLA